MTDSSHDTLVYRLAQMLVKLNQGEKLNPQALADEFGVNLRTIQRDLNVRFAYLPLQKTDGYYHLDPTFLGKLSTKDVDRFAGLAGVRGLFPSLSDDFLRDIFDARIQAAVMVKGHNYENMAGKEAAFRSLEQAIVGRQHIAFDYQKDSGLKSYGGVAPFKLINHKGIWYLRHGTTTQRTHVDVDLGIGLRGIEVVREAVAALGNTITTQIVAFPQDGVLRRPGVLDLLDQAAAAGADYIGGLDPASIDRDPVGQLDGIFAIAEKHGCGIDLHLHDPAELGVFQIELMIKRTIRHGLQGKVNVAHGFAVGQVDPGYQAELIARMAEAGMSMTSVSPLKVPPLPIKAMLKAGVPVGLGTDGFRDLWGPHGDGDMLKVALKTAQMCGFRYDEDLVLALELATSRGAAFAGVPSQNLAVGDRADIVLLDAENPMDAVVRTPRREAVLAGGKIVVYKGELVI